MSGLEQAIRNALERADRANPEIRSRIYQSARNALDAGLRKQEISDAETLARQRERLEQTIEAIETEERERLRSMAHLEKVLIEREPEPEPEPEIRPEIRREPRSEPVVEEARPSPTLRSPEPQVHIPPVHEAAPKLDQEKAEPTFSHDDGGSLAGLSATREDVEGRHPLHEEEEAEWAEPDTPEGRVVPEKRRSAARRAGSFVISLFIYCVLLGVIGFGAWWIYATGLFDLAMRGKGNFELVPKELQTEDFDPNKGERASIDPLRGFNSDWINVFDPKKIELVTPRADAKITSVSDSDGAAISISSPAPDQAGEVLITIPSSILKDLAGKTSIIALTLRADSDTSTQIYVQCEFTTLGDCGRHRFTVPNERSDELIKVNFDGKLGPTEDGHIVVNSDLTGRGRGIRIYGIRVLPGA